MTPSVASRPAATPAANETNYAQAYGICVDKARRNIDRLAARPISAAWAIDGNYFGFAEGFFEIGNWTSSFFTGMALQAFESTGDFYFLSQVNRLADAYREKVTLRRMDTMHDLGFLYSLYSVAVHRLTGDLHHRRTGLYAADELAKRFSARGGYLQAWGRMDDAATPYAGLAIIDSLMNLPLLFWASRETGNRYYHEIALRHADTTLAFFVRPDDSVYHAFRFDVATGAAVRPDNYCGHAVESHWARGSAWAMYGFALAYRHSGVTRYLDAAMRIARKFCAQLDGEIVPKWDFRLSAGQPPLRDSSAAAIAVGALDEINVHGKDPLFTDVAEALLQRLCTTTYLDADPNCPGVLRLGEVGDGPADSAGYIRAKNVYASWGDYFFMEALARRLSTPICFW